MTNRAFSCRHLPTRRRCLYPWGAEHQERRRTFSNANNPRGGRKWQRKHNEGRWVAKKFRLFWDNITLFFWRQTKGVTDRTNERRSCGRSPLRCGGEEWWDHLPPFLPSLWKWSRINFCRRAGAVWVARRPRQQQPSTLRVSSPAAFFRSVASPRALIGKTKASEEEDDTDRNSRFASSASDQNLLRKRPSSRSRWSSEWDRTGPAAATNQL